MLAGSVSASPAYLEAFLPVGKEMKSLFPATVSSVSEWELISQSKLNIEESVPYRYLNMIIIAPSELPFPTRVVSEVGSLMAELRSRDLEIRVDLILHVISRIASTVFAGVSINIFFLLICAPKISVDKLRIKGQKTTSVTITHDTS
jgi:hypothetical protein